MAGSVNKVILVGNVGNDPEIRSLNSGDRVCNFSLATSESWRDKQSGERKEKTEWHRIVVFNDGLVGVIERYVKKGSKLYIEGQLQTRKWTDRDGNDKYTTEIVLQRYRGELAMLDSRSEGGGGYGGGQSGGSNYSGGQGGGGGNRGNYGGGQSGGGQGGSQSNESSSSYDLDDEIPF